MKTRPLILSLFGLLGAAASAWAEPAAPLALIDPSSSSALTQFEPSSGQVSLISNKEVAGLTVNIKGGPEGYPGVTLKPEKPWDLSAYGYVEAKVTNTGLKKGSVCLRLDNSGEGSPWNGEVVYLDPGASKTVRVTFGYSFGHPGYALKPNEITRLLLFSGKSAEDQSFRVESIMAGGSPGDKPVEASKGPAEIRVKPVNGLIVGESIPLDAAKQITVKDGAEGVLAADGKTVQITFSKKGQSAALKPAAGMWDLREAHQVHFKIKNTGTGAFTPAVRVESKGGPTDVAKASAPLAPGASTEIVASFIPAVPWLGIKDSFKTEWNPTSGTGTKFTSDAASAVTFLADANAGSQKFEIESVTVAAPPAVLPDWLGKRPPVEGDWVPTFSEEFDGNSINLSKWNIYTPNYWDKLSHFSKDNVIVKDGLARLVFEKKTGNHGDIPTGKETPYATGFIDTYGKWVQRYGYFEARMKLPKAPGLWPAMWLMPDRGLAAGEQWKRADTGNGGMEFDIMEFLSRWGGYRFNVAYHWDGYGKGHQQTGTTTAYVEADKDGFVTTGLLWTPGLAVIYNNGREISRWESPRISNVPSDIMFTHVMGGWDNNALDDAQLPADFVIDYVRVWQRKDLASPADGVKSTQATTAGPTTPDPVQP